MHPALCSLQIREKVKKMRLFPSVLQFTDSMSSSMYMPTPLYKRIKRPKPNNVHGHTVPWRCSAVAGSFRVVPLLLDSHLHHRHRRHQDFNIASCSNLSSSSSQSRCNVILGPYRSNSYMRRTITTDVVWSAVSVCLLCLPVGHVREPCKNG